MKHHDSHRLTAWALGELPKEQRLAVAASMDADASAREEVAQVRALSRRLRAELQSEPAGELTQDQRSELFELAAKITPFTGDWVGTDEMVEPTGVLSSANKPMDTSWRWGFAACVVATLSLAAIWAMIQGESRHMTENAHAAVFDASISIHPDFEQEPAMPPETNLESIVPPAIPENLKKRTADQKWSRGMGKRIMSSNLAAVARAQPSRPSFAALPLTASERTQPILPGSGILESTSERLADITTVSYLSQLDHSAFRGSAAMDTFRVRPAFIPPARSAISYSVPFVPPEEVNWEEEPRDVPFLPVASAPLSFVPLREGTGSIAVLREAIQNGELPQPDHVRISELLRYAPASEMDRKDNSFEPLVTDLELAECPWNLEHGVLRVTIRSPESVATIRTPANLVFLIDLSGSMAQANKLPLLKETLRTFSRVLHPRDRVSIVVHGGARDCILEPTGDRAAFCSAVDGLQAGQAAASINALQRAYEIAEQHLIRGGNNRIILCTDGVQDSGNRNVLFAAIEARRKTGICLSAFGFGLPGSDSVLESLAAHGGGHSGIVHTLSDGVRMFTAQAGVYLPEVASDVVAQIEFNPARVAAFRPLGVDAEVVPARFTEGRVPAEWRGTSLFAGSTTTALFEIIPAWSSANAKDTGLKYQQVAVDAQNIDPNEWLSLKVRWTPLARASMQSASEQIESVLTIPDVPPWVVASAELRWASAVAAYGLLLRDSPHRGNASWALVENLALESIADGATDAQRDLIHLIHSSRKLKLKAESATSAQ